MDIQNLQLPLEINKKFTKTITSICKLYRIKDITVDNMTIVDFQQLYGKLLNQVIGKLGILESKKFGGKDKETKQKKVLRVNEEKRKELDRLALMSENIVDNLSDNERERLGIENEDIIVEMQNE